MKTQHGEQLQRTYAQMNEIVYDSRKTLSYIGDIETRLRSGQAIDQQEAAKLSSVINGLAFLHQQYSKPLNEFRELDRYFATQLSAIPANAVDPVETTPLVVAGVLAVSGVAKLGDVSEGVRGLRELQVPDWLVRDGVARAHPIAEIVIGLGLVLLPTPWRTVAAVAALGLLAAYTVLVLAALRRAREVRCNCFGRRKRLLRTSQ